MLTGSHGGQSRYVRSIERAGGWQRDLDISYCKPSRLYVDFINVNKLLTGMKCVNVNK